MLLLLALLKHVMSSAPFVLRHEPPDQSFKYITQTTIVVLRLTSTRSESLLL